MPDYQTKHDALSDIITLLTRAIDLSDGAEQDVLGAHLAHAQACAEECLGKLNAAAGA